MCEHCINTYPVGTKVVLADGYTSDMVIPGHEYKVLAHKVCVFCRTVLIDIGIRNEINPDLVITKCPHCAEYELLRDGGIVWCFVKYFIPLNEFKSAVEEELAEYLFFEKQRERDVMKYRKKSYVFQVPASKEKYWELTIPPNKVNEPSKN